MKISDFDLSTSVFQLILSFFVHFCIYIDKSIDCVIDENRLYFQSSNCLLNNIVLFDSSISYFVYADFNLLKK